MLDELFNLVSVTQITPDKLGSYLMRLLSATVLSTIAAISYSLLQRKERIRMTNLPYTMILYSVMVCGLMLVIGESVARAFGLLGALSLVRFRVNLKNPTDMAAILFAVTIGITCGIYLPFFGLVFTVVVLAIFALIHCYTAYQYRLMRLLVIDGPGKTIRKFLKEIESRFRVVATISSPESMGKNPIWNASLKFVDQASLHEWEAWIKKEDNILYSLENYEISMDISEWDIPAPAQPSS